MFLDFPLQVTGHTRQLALLLNTGLLIAALLMIELLYSEMPKERRQYIIYFIPFVTIMIGLVIYAVFVQGSKP